MTPKTKTLTATAVFVCLAVLFFMPAAVPYKLAFPVASLFVASLWLNPWQICVALAFSALGDWFGTTGRFIPQVCAFAIVHVFYIWFFVKRYLTKVEHDRKLTAKAKGYIVMLMVCLVGLMTVVFARIIPAAPAGVDRIGVGVYSVLILAMLVMAMLQRSTLYAIGGLLFVFSDFILAWNRFVEPVPYATYVIMLSYYLGQWLLFVRSTPYRIASLRPFRF